MGNKFTDKRMHPEDKGLWKGQRKIVGIFKENRQQILVSYESDISKRAKDKAKDDDINDASGDLTINETHCFTFLIYKRSIKVHTNIMPRKTSLETTLIIQKSLFDPRLQNFELDHQC